MHNCDVTTLSIKCIIPFAFACICIIATKKQVSWSMSVFNISQGYQLIKNLNTMVQVINDGFDYEIC